MPSAWTHIPHTDKLGNDVLPPDATLVWVRRSYPAEPFKGTWRLSSGDFLLGNGLIIPWFHVLAWRLI